MKNKKFKVVIVNGFPGTGKTSFETLCQWILTPRYCVMRSTVDEIKRIAKECGWNGEKDAKSRKFLSDLKDLLTEFNDLPFNDIVAYAENYENQLAYMGFSNHPHILFVDAREPEGIQRLKDKLDAVTLLIRRTVAEDNIQSNHADQNVLNYRYDYVINNDGTIDELAQKANDFISELFK